MDRKTLLNQKYAGNKLNFSEDEEEMKMTIEELGGENAMAMTGQSKEGEDSNSPKSEEGQELGEEMEDQEFDEEQEEEEEEEESVYEGSFVNDDQEEEGENSKVDNTDPNLPKPLINQNLNLDRNYVKPKIQYPATPAIIKRRQAKGPWFNSPTDSCLSPCTQKIFKGRKPLN